MDEGKKRERERILFELRAKRNQARQAHKEEVLAETIGEKLKRTEGHGEYLAQRKAAEQKAVDDATPHDDGESEGAQTMEKPSRRSLSRRGQGKGQAHGHHGGRDGGHAQAQGQARPQRGF